LKSAFAKQPDILEVEVKLNLKDDVLAILFGMLIILITFGDNRVHPWVGNLDQIFGQSFWRFMDVLYPLASVTIFLLYGKAKGGLRIHVLTVLIFFVFLMVLSMMIIDDMFVVLHHSIKLPDNYWGIASWIYPLVSITVFLAFGWICARLKGGLNTS
jgi:hypothetical protein